MRDEFINLTPENLADRIRTKRKAKGIFQEKMAEQNQRKKRRQAITLK